MIIRQALADARGENEWVVASLIDIRSFTSYSMEAVEAALFLKTVYIRILDGFVPKDAFVKLTGDGMLVVEAYEPGALGAALEATIDRWLALLGEFPTMTDADPEIRFSVPSQLGIGVEFGAASRLVSGDDTLDFFGKPLNVAARLCDLARPSGLVISDAAALPERLNTEFAEDAVYLKGISETTRVPVWYTKSMTVIPSFAKYPLVEPEWALQKLAFSMTKLAKLAESNNTRYHVVLPERPLGDEVAVRVEYALPIQDGTFFDDLDETHFSYTLEAGIASVRLDSSAIVSMLQGRGVRPRADLVFIVTYPRRPGV